MSDTPITNAPTTHGVLVTFRRPELLVDHLRRLAAQTSPLSRLIVVDNDADPAIREITEGPHGRAAAGSVRYLALDGNAGPAGGFTAGITAVLREAEDDDLVVLLDDNDPPRTDSVFADSIRVCAQLAAAHDDIGGVGSFGATLQRRGRLRMATATAPTPVDYLAGGGCPHYRVAALRVVGGPDPSLFFGFEELEFGLALRRSGFRLWSSGLARAHGWAEMMESTRAAAKVAAPTWRRYYGMRNIIVALRRDGRTADAVFVSAVAGLAKPTANLVVNPRDALANLSINARAVRDAWQNRLGTRVDPVPVTDIRAA